MPLWVEIAAGVVAVALAAYALYKLLKKKPPPMPIPLSQPSQQQQQSQSGSQTPIPAPIQPEDPEDEDEDEPPQSEPEPEEEVYEPPAPDPEKEKRLEEKVKKIKGILTKDQTLAEEFAKAYARQTAVQLRRDEPVIKQIAAQIPDEQLELYNLASNQDLLKFNVSAKTTYEKSNYPTDRIEIEPIGDDYAQVQYALSEQFLLPNIEFARQLVMNELLVINFYEKNVKARLLYILLDISGSMQFLLLSGLPRHVWARGVIINLLIQAQKDGGKFFYREFGDSPRVLRIVQTVPEMKALAQLLLRETKDDGGTNIKAALSAAVQDIRTQGGDIANADLLIITDGEDDVDSAWLKDLLKDDIKLHFVALGLSTKSGRESLKGVAKTFAQFT